MVFRCLKKLSPEAVRCAASTSEGLGHYSRKQIDELTKFVGQYGARGLAYLAMTPEGEQRSSFAKFLNETSLAGVLEKMETESGDLLIVRGRSSCCGL